ncbi:MAG: hypothetical protein EOO29_21870 [Comamonadaceae bacterium]|nr:MAG: hypothetical protein EOO29_21870 [Comamonadaceae bacterium]
MRNAPSVSFPVGRSPFEGRLLLGLGLAGGCALGLWRWQTAASDLLAVCLLGLWAASCLLAWRQWRASPTGWLHWRDGAWSLGLERASADHDISLTRLRVALDFQTVLLLELGSASRRPRWLWLALRDDPAQWNAVRRAFHARMQPVDARLSVLAGPGERA